MKVLRAINRLKFDENIEASNNVLLDMRNTAKNASKKGNKNINNLIRNHLITNYMASSLVNDHENLNDMIKKLLEVGELLYGEKDSILEP